MPLTRPGGFALMEMLTGLVLTGLLGLAFVQAALHLQRVARAERDGAALQIAFDGALGFLSSDVAEIGHGSTGDDLLRLAPDSMTYRAVRSASVACRVGATEVVVQLDRFDAARLPQPGRDSLLLFIAADSLSVASGRWTVLPLLGVGSASCGGRPGLRLATVIDTVAIPPASLPALPPVRTFEVMQARLYQSLGAWWLGARSESAGESIQPLAGPFDSVGTPFSYLDSLQQPTLIPAGVEAIQFRLSGTWSGWPGTGAGRPDSAAQRLTPRNLGP
jgi:hypothetical protein